jgi:hypothetical protein
MAGTTEVLTLQGFSLHAGVRSEPAFDQIPWCLGPERDQGRPLRLGWARLLKRVFNLDLEHCPNCGGELRIIAAILEVSPDTKGPEDRLCLAHAKASVPWQPSDREDTEALRTRGQSATPLACTGADGLLKTRC